MNIFLHLQYNRAILLFDKTYHGYDYHKNKNKIPGLVSYLDSEAGFKILSYCTTFLSILVKNIEYMYKTLWLRIIFESRFKCSKKYPRIYHRNVFKKD